MFKAIGNSYTGMRAHQLKLDNASHNISNLETTGYKERQVRFQDLHYKPLTERRLPNLQQQELTPQTGVGAGYASMATGHHQQGDMLMASKPTEMAIEGPGFFRVTRLDGTYAYTRSGAFSLNADGNLQAPGGELLEPPLNLAERDDILYDSISISPSGEIVAVNTEGEEVELGRVGLYNFTNPEGLLSEGSTYYIPTGASGEPQEGFPGDEGFGSVRGGYLEGSTVDIGKQMVELIKSQRGLQFSSRSMTTAEELWAMTLGIRN